MQSSGITDTGSKRKNNQDSIFFSDEPVGSLPNLYIVADGMGGHRAGDKASRMAIDITVDFIKKSSIISYSREALEAIHLDIEAFATSEQLTAHANSIKVRFE